MKRLTTLLVTLLLVVGCGAQDLLEDIVEDAEESEAVGAEAQKLIADYCDYEMQVRDRPIEETRDEGGTVEAGSRLYAVNINGPLHVLPSTDGKITWAARKRIFTRTKEEVEEAAAKTKVKTQTQDDETQVVVDYPASTDPENDPYYETCLVAKVPLEVAQELNNGSGDIVSSGTEGNLIVANASGDIFIAYNGNGTVATQNVSGDTIIEQAGSGTVSASSASGDIVADGYISSKVELISESGDVIYFLKAGDASLGQDINLASTSGDVNLVVEGSIAYRLDAETVTGDISAPESYPQPEEVDVTGMRLSAEINGSGLTIRIRTTSGSINVSN